MRETTTVTQHVAWVDLIPETETTDRYRNAAELPIQNTFSWNGIAQETLPLANYPETFTRGNKSFNLAAPEVKAGQPVPPPYYTLVVRLLNPEKTQTLAEVKQRIYVPQVVQVKWQSSGEALFRTPKVYAPDSTTSNLVYSAIYAGDSAALMEETLQRLRAYYPEDVNIRFVPFFSSDIETTKFLFVTADIRQITIADNRETYEYGVASSGLSLQRSATGLASCYLGSIYDSTFALYQEFAGGNKPSQPFPIPISSPQMLEALCRVSAHEVGHTLGLVDTTFLDGVVNNHNPGNEDQTKIMNVNTDLKWLFKPHSTVGWRPLNASYLRFILPVPK